MANTKVQSEQIQDGSITADKIADGAIVATELADNAVTTAKINADAVTGAKIADDAIDSEHYTDGSIDTAHIADSQITVAKMAANSVDSDQYVDGSIDTVHIGDSQVTTAKIANGNISTAKLADNSVTSAKLDTNIDIAGTLDVTGASTLDAGLTVDTTTLVVDASNNRVGIGTATPSQILNVEATSTPVIEISTLDDNNPASASALDLIEKQPTHAADTATFGQTGVYGYRIQLNGSDNSLRIKSGVQTTVNDRITLDRDTGKVGIGTTSPTNTLDLGAATSGRALTFANYTNLFSEYSNASGWLSSNFYGNAGAAGYKTGATGNFGAAGIRVHGTGGGGNSGIIQFFTDTNSNKTAGDAFTPTEKMRLTENSHLGVGGTLASFSTGGYSTHPLYVQTGVSNGTAATDAFVHIGQPVGLSNANTDGYISGISLGYHENNTNYKHTAIGVRAHGDGAARRDMVFLVNSTYESASASLGDSKLTISSGNGVVSGDLNDTSDKGFKKNIKNLGNTLDLVKQLKPRTFTWKGRKAARGDSVGFIAQEVKEVIKDETIVQGSAYEKDGDTGLSINTVGLVSYLTKAIQEQQTIIDDLKARIEALES